MDDEEIMGEEDGYDVVGDDVLGEEMATVGAVRRARGLRAAAAAGRILRLPARAAWGRQLSPGVAMPGQGLEPLPLTPNLNNGVFNATNSNIRFEGRPQAKFRAERLLVTLQRAATLAPAPNAILCLGIFIGRQLGTVEFANFNVEVYAPNAFGVRLNLPVAQPGMLVSLPCFVASTITAGDISVQMQFLGRTVR